jgi:ribosomal protein S12 methylthiotransferase
MKIGLISLGCPKNQVDLERFAGALPKRAQLTDRIEDADLVVINSCGFISEASLETVETLLDARARVKQGAKIALTGCFTERYKDHNLAEELKEANFFAGVNEFDKLLDYIRFLDDEAVKDGGEVRRILLNPSSYAYLKISDGCNNRCTYCTIPAIRGNLRSFDKFRLLSETAALADDGVKEIIIIAQDITKYGLDTGDTEGLPALLDELAGTFKNLYFRLLYLNPDGVTDRLIDTVIRNDNIIRYFDIPLQHASDRMLKRMGRHYNSAQAKGVIRALRSAIPDVFIRTTFIVGFPGESEDDFKAAADFLTEYKPDYAGFFLYSPEEGTPAYGFPERTLKKIARPRLKKLQSIQKNNTLNRLRKLKEITVFADKRNADFDFILEGHAVFQTPEIDGMTYIIGGTADRGAGAYKARIKKIAYPDIYAELI